MSERISSSQVGDTESAAVSSYELSTVRDLVYRRSSAAADHAAKLRERLGVLSARAELLSALAEANAGGEHARRRVLAGIKAVQSLGPRDPETLLDVAFGLLVADRPGDAAAVVLESIDATTPGGSVHSVEILDALDSLDRGDRRLEADELLTSLLKRLLASAAPETSLGASALDPLPGAGRRLPGAIRSLTDFVSDNVGRMVEASRQRKADKELLSALQRLALGPPRWEAVARWSAVNTLPFARRRLLTELLAPTERRLVNAPDDRMLRTLYAAAVVTVGQCENGLALADEVLADEPDHQLAHWVRIAALARLARYDDALDELGVLPEEVTATAGATALRVRLLSRAGRHVDAVDAADEALAADQPDVDVVIAKAEVLAADGDREQALKVLEKEQLQPPELLKARAELLQTMDRTADAFELLFKVVENDPDDLEAHVILSRVYAEGGQADPALAELDDALSLAPGRADLLLDRARLLRSAERYVEALHTVEEVQPAPAGDHETLALRADLLARLGRRDEALSSYLEAFNQSSEKGDASDVDEYVRELETLARDLFDEGRYDAALAPLDALFRARSLSSDGMALRAELLRLDKRWREAVDQADAAISAGADGIWMAATKGDCLVTLCRGEQALKVIEPALSEDPDYLFARYVCARALDTVGRASDALDLLEEHLATPDREVWTIRLQAQLLTNLGRFPEAVHELKAALEESGSDEGEWRVPLGVAYHRLGRVADAIEALRAVETMEDPANWVLLELADALAHAATSCPPAALALYERVAGVGFNETEPYSGCEAGWALLRLERTDEAIGAYESAFKEAEDPLLEEHLNLVMALALDGRATDAEAELERTVRKMAALDDRRHAEAMLGEGRHRLALLRRDAVWAEKVDRLEAVEQRLHAEATKAVNDV
jgi:tetratricopeptide (TPR) repeat protein